MNKKNRILCALFSSKLNNLRNILLLCVCGGSFLYLLIILDGSEFVISNRKYASLVNPERKNYFLKMKEQNIGLLINTTKCNIPNFSPLDQEILSFFEKAKPNVDCAKEYFNWSYIHNMELVINSKQMQKDGHSFTNQFCCYKTIRRVAQDLDDYDDENADNNIEYSNCIPIINERTKILNEEFISVECGRSWISLKPWDVTYRMFHTIPMGSRQPNVQKKMDFYKSQTQDTKLRPPNILVLGLDSTSRLNMQRQMHKTVKLLQDLGTVEMLGYTKVGQNTYPNFLPIFTGYSSADINKICFPGDKLKPFDGCHFIFSRFDDANYLTGLSEDSPIFAAFNYMKSGFVKQPVDFYLRPFFLALADYRYPMHIIRSEHTDCVGYKTNDEAILSYVESQFDFASNNGSNTPIFSFTWSTTTTHSDFNMLQLLDSTYATFLEKLKNKGHLDNTIVFVMGDHGYRYGSFRQTLIGYYEDKLPAMWIYLPPQIQKSYPEWKESLEMNAMQLTSPFTLHATFNKILDTFTSTKPLSDAQDPLTGYSVPQKVVQSFFDRMSRDSSCEELGIPPEYCACHTIDGISIDDEKLLIGAQEGIKYINKILPDVCVPLSLQKITSGAIMDMSSDSNLRRYIIGLMTSPGAFDIEIEINFDGTFSKEPSIHRGSKINQDHVKCVKDILLEQFCYCK